MKDEETIIKIYIGIIKMDQKQFNSRLITIKLYISII